MKLLLVCLAFWLGQIISLHEKPVVHLAPKRDTINADFGGKLLELINAPDTVYLPQIPPRGESFGHPWSVDVKNMGPQVVTIEGKRHFEVRISTGQTVHISATESGYTLH